MSYKSESLFRYPYYLVFKESRKELHSSDEKVQASCSPSLEVKHYINPTAIILDKVFFLCKYLVQHPVVNLLQNYLSQSYYSFSLTIQYKYFR